MMRMITPGTILIEKGTLLPAPLELENESQASGWMPVANNLDRQQLENELATAGWTFFYMAGKITANAFGFDRQKMIHAALMRIITNVKREKCNCIEIDEVATHSLLGMPYVNVSAHSCHVQKGLVWEAAR